MFKTHEITTLDAIIMYGSVAFLLYVTYHIGKGVGKEELKSKLNNIVNEYEAEKKRVE